MRFGIWDHFEHRPGIEVGDQYQEKIHLVAEAERMGFAYYHVAEHHLSPLDIAPSPTVFLAALAQVTSTIRVGTGVYCLPLHHPVRLVQELCMLDHLSGGRLDIGVGRGIRAIEHQWFGVAQEETGPRFGEMLQILVKAMSTGNLEHTGTYYQFPDLPLDILPVQQPHPPLWYAGGTEAAGRGGFNFLTRNIDDLLRYWELWEETRERSDRFNAHLDRPTATMTRHVVVRDTYEQAEAIARRSWPVFESHWYSTPVRVSEEGVPVSDEQRTFGQDFDEALQQDRRLLIGTPEMLRTKLEEWSDRSAETPGFDFAPAVQWGDITTDEALESLELVAQGVMPAFGATVQ